MRWKSTCYLCFLKNFREQDRYWGQDTQLGIFMCRIELVNISTWGLGESRRRHYQELLWGGEGCHGVLPHSWLMLCTCLWDYSQCTQNPLSSVYLRVLILFLGGQAAILLPSLSQLKHHGMLNALSTQENILVNDYTSARVTAPHL